MSNRIRELRLAREKMAPGAFTAAALASRIGVTEGALLQWERAETKPRKRHATKLARALNVEVAALGLEETKEIRPPERPPVAMAVIVRDRRLLMTKRRFKENVVGRGPTMLWSFPSGEVEGDETPEAAAVRETMEELGVEIHSVARIAEQVHPLSPTKRRFVYVACEIVRGEPDIVDHEELLELRWCTLDEANKLVEVVGGFAEPLLAHLVRELVPGATRPAGEEGRRGEL